MINTMHTSHLNQQCITFYWSTFTVHALVLFLMLLHLHTIVHVYQFLSSIMTQEQIRDIQRNTTLCFTHVYTLYLWLWPAKCMWVGPNRCILQVTVKYLCIIVYIVGTIAFLTKFLYFIDRPETVTLQWCSQPIRLVKHNSSLQHISSEATSHSITQLQNSLQCTRTVTYSCTLMNLPRHGA